MITLANHVSAWLDRKWLGPLWLIEVNGTTLVQRRFVKHLLYVEGLLLNRLGVRVLLMRVDGLFLLALVHSLQVELLRRFVCEGVTTVVVPEIHSHVSRDLIIVPLVVPLVKMLLIIEIVYKILDWVVEIRFLILETTRTKRSGWASKGKEGWILKV